MIDARLQIKELLEGIELSKPFKVKMKFPQSVSDGVMVTYFELLNKSTNIPVVDEIAYQLDCWAYDMETLVELSQKVDDALIGMGLLRQFTSPDYPPDEQGGYFRKTMRYGRRADTRTNRLID